ncbi:WGR domain-containing protein [uncultured Jannaschia sp.]|uniref:WGR domain-containing protein n=1 Tax=uncultured Jannaschia sp. TaxID=293347 RepID=UPI0034356934
MFGSVSLIREWDRIGSGGRILAEHHADEGETITSLLTMARTKGRRGYDDRSG